MSTVSNPHDVFCKHVLGRPDLAAGFLRHFLPDDVVAGLDLSRLRAVPGEFVDAELANHHSDLLFAVPGPEGAETLVYVLIEHKSEPDRGTPLQLLRYMTRIWGVCCKEKQALPLPPILPVLVCQGDRPWPWPPLFQDIIQTVPGLAPFVPSFSFRLVDLFRVDDATLPDDPQLGSALLIMKHVQRERLAQAILDQAARFMALLFSQPGLDLFKTMVIYIANVLPQEKRDPIWKALQRATAPQGEQRMRTIADSFRDEGLAKGIDLARAEAKHFLANMVLEEIEERFGTLPQGLAERIHCLPDMTSLKAVQRALRKAASIDDCVRIVAGNDWN